MTYDWDSHVPGHHEIELASGRYLNLEHPDPATITVEDIAQGLAFTCRYSGQCAEFYSVAQHAVMCARYLAREGHPLEIQLAGLHHDDHEAFLGDVVRPLKGLLQPAYGHLAARMDLVISRALGDLWPAGALTIPEVKAADNWALMIEARRLLVSRGKHWGAQASNWDLDTTAADDAGDLWVPPAQPWIARRMFLHRHHWLVGQIAKPEAA